MYRLKRILYLTYRHSIRSNSWDVVGAFKLARMIVNEQ